MFTRLIQFRQFFASIRFFFTRQLLTKALSLLVVGSLLANSTPAAPEVMIASASEFGQDIRYSILSSPTLAALGEYSLWDNPILAFILGKKKQQSIARIEISPKRATIREGEEINFTAVGIDSRGNPVQGLEIRWTAKSTRQKAASVPIINGSFKPQFSDRFEITAESNGIKEAAVIQVLKDPYLLAAKEIDTQMRGKEVAQKQRQLRNDVQKVINAGKATAFKVSTRMSPDEARQINLREKEFQKENPRLNLTDPKEKFRPIKKALPVQPNKVGEALVVNEENAAKTVGGPNSGEGEQENSNLVSGVNGYLNGVVGANVTGCAEQQNYYGVSVDFYIDGDLYSGSYAGSAFTGMSCDFSFQIPSNYQDGQPHTISAFVWDNDYGYWVELNNSPLSFQLGGSGSGTNSNWNNGNYTTADDPGLQPGEPANDGTEGAGSGNFGFSAPVLSLAGRGMSVNLSLNYNSLLWHKAGSEISYDIDKGNPAPGWNIGYGKMMDMGSTGGSMIEDTDGSRHAYQGTAANFWSGGYSHYYGQTTDGSFIDYSSYKGPGGIISGAAYFPNGTIINYGAAANGVAYPTKILDRHGNYMLIAYQNNQGPNITTVTDNLGRVITFNYDGGNRLVSVSGPAQNGGTRVYVRIHYAQKTVTPSFTGLTPQIRDANPYQIDAIYYPDLNKGYWFGDGGSSPSYSSYGMLTKVMEMRGMSWSGANNNDQGSISMGTVSRQMVYNYPLTAANLTKAPEYTTMTETWDGMTSSPAVTTYSINNNSTPRTTTITLPNQNKIVQSSYNAPNQANDGLLYQVETLSPSNQVLAKSVTSWGQGDYDTNRVTQIESTDEKQQTTKQTFTYDSYYNQVATVSEYGYSNNLLRKKVNTYENGANYRGGYNTVYGFGVWSWGRHIFSLAKTEELLDAGNNRLSRNDYSYDQASLTNTPNVVMYDQTFNPNTTETIQGPNCVNWDYQWNGWDYDYVCVEYEQIPNFDSSTLARGNVTNTTTYAEASNLTGAISYDSTYDIVGNARTTTTNCCQQMSFSYSTATQYSQPDSHTKGSSDVNSPYRMTESATYDFNTGLLKTSVDFNGRTTTYQYDAANRPENTYYPTGLHTQLWYHPNENEYSEIIWQGSNYTSVENWFNGRGQQRQRSEYHPNNLSNYWDAVNWTDSEVTYDEMGRKLTASIPHQRNVASAGNTTYQYDILSRVTQVTAPDGSTSKTFYNETTKPSSGTTTVGNTVRSQDAWGRERWARTDDFGRLAEVVEPDPNGNGSIFDAGNLQTQYSYNAKDELTQVNQGSQERKFWYDSLGRLVRQKLAEQNGSLTAGGQFVGGNNGGWSDTFVYDNRSNLVQRTDARGVKTNFNYTLGGSPDPLNRLQQVSYDKTGADTTYNIPDASPVNLSYMTTGDKTRVSQANTWYVNEENSYDIEGRISEYKVVYAQQTSQPFVTSYLYDTLSRLTEVRYPAQYGMTSAPRKVVTPTYDTISRLQELKVDNQIQMSEINYNPMSQVTQLKTGAATGNADVEQYSYDGQTGLLTNQKVLKASNNQSLLDLSYEYNRGNSKGNLNGKTGQLTHVVDNLNRNKDRVFEFDTLGRLITAKGGGATGVGGVTANWTQQYSFDRYGNRLSVAGNGITQNSQATPTDGWASMGYDNATNRITTAGYIYDLAGNLVKGQSPDGTWQRYDYDSAGRLVTVKKDADGWIQQNNGYGSSRQRVVSWSYASTALTWYVWGGSSVLAEYTAPSWQGAYTWAKSYIYAGSRLLSTFTNNGNGGETLEFHHPDRLGTRLVTNNTANTSFEQNTLPFGTALDAESTGASNQRFTSYDRSTVASLDYAVNRSYSSGQGRFTTVDPIGMSATSKTRPQSLNLFAYTQNNPIDFVDPSGLNKQAPGSGGQSGILYTLYYGHSGDWKALFSWFVPNGNGGNGDESGGDQANPPQEKSSCGKFVDKIMDLFKTYWVFGTQTLGWRLMAEGYWHSKQGFSPRRQEQDSHLQPVDGFKNNLTRWGQLGQVYQHVLGHAGAIITGDSKAPPYSNMGNPRTTGYETSDQQMEADFKQSKDTRTGDDHGNEALTELQDDIVGRSIGATIAGNMKTWGPDNMPDKKTFDLIGNQIFKELCDK